MRNLRVGPGLECYVTNMVGMADLVTVEAIQHIVPKAPWYCAIASAVPWGLGHEVLDGLAGDNHTMIVVLLNALTRCWISLCLLTCIQTELLIVHLLPKGNFICVAAAAASCDISRSKLSHVKQQLGCKCPEKQWHALAFLLSFILVCCLNPSSDVRLLSRLGGQCTLVTSDNVSDMHNNDVAAAAVAAAAAAAAASRRCCRACRSRCPMSQ